MSATPFKRKSHHYGSSPKTLWELETINGSPLSLLVAHAFSDYGGEMVKGVDEIILTFLTLRPPCWLLPARQSLS